MDNLSPSYHKDVSVNAFSAFDSLVSADKPAISAEQDIKTQNLAFAESANLFHPVDQEIQIAGKKYHTIFTRPEIGDPADPNRAIAASKTEVRATKKAYTNFLEAAIEYSPGKHMAVKDWVATRTFKESTEKEMAETMQVLISLR